jgi:hypothetical protein
MNIKKKLSELLTYYGSTRNTGHTTLLKEGTKHYDRPFFVLVHNANYGTELGIDPKDTVSYQNLDKLRGHKRPIVFDNGVMRELLSDALMRIESLEAENKFLLECSQTIIVTTDKKHH